MAIVEILDPTYIKSKLDNLDISLTTLRDALRGTGNKTLTDLDTGLSNILSKLDVNLSTRASDSTLSSFSGKFPSAASLSDNISNPTTTIVGSALLGFDGTVWRRVRVDTNGNFIISASVDKTKIWDGTDYLEIASDGKIGVTNIDVALSTRASESTLSGIKTGTDYIDDIYNRLDVNLSTRLSETTFTSRVPTMETKSLDVSGATRNALIVLSSIGGDITRQPYTIDDINVGTTEGSTSIAAPGAKILSLTNKSDTDILIGLNASVPGTNPMKLPARTKKIILHQGVTSVYYKTASGSAVLKIEYIN